MIASAADWLQQLRIGRQLSQRELGAALGYSSESVRKFEARGNRPSAGYATSLASYLGLVGPRADELVHFLRYDRADRAQRIPDWIIALAEPAPASRAPTNLPVPLTRLVGRDEDVARGCALLARPGVRLLTCTGPAGVGKTRLALAVAERMRDVVRDGVYLVELAPLRDPHDIERAIADALRLRDSAGRTPGEALVDYLHGKHLLLVLDNLEHLAQPPRAPAEQHGLAQQRIAALLRHAPQLVALVTSRARLHIAGERVWTVQPLAHAPAIQLFVDRVQDSQPAFALDASNAPAVAQLCTDLEGVPLAIELAAAQCDESRPPAAVAALLRQRTRLSVLVDGALDQDVRHHTLRVAIEWSFGLLDARAQRLFCRLGLFVGGFTAAAAAALLDAPDQPAGSDNDDDHAEQQRTVRAVLRALVEANLVRTSHGAAERFSLLATVREFALDQLRLTDDEAAAARTHARFYVELAERVEPELVGPDQARLLRRCEDEHDNLRAALAWLLEHDEVELAARLASAVWRFWWTHGHLTEGRAWLDRVLRHAARLPPRLRARALTGGGILDRAQFAFDQARDRLSQALAIWQHLQSADGSALALINMGIIGENLRQYDVARDHYAECLDYYRQAGDERGEAHVLNNLSVIAIHEGHFERAAEYGQDSLELFDRLGIDERGRALVLRNLGWIATAQQRFDQARSWLDSSLAISRRLEDREGSANTLNNRALLEYTAATNEAGLQQAMTLATDALHLFHTLADDAGLAESLELLAGCAGRLGQRRTAARAFGVAEVLRRRSQTAHFPSQQHTYRTLVSAARQRVAPTAWSADWAEGAARPDAILAELLDQPPL